MKYIHQYILAYAVIVSYLTITVILLYLSFSPTPMQDSTGSVFMLLGGLSSALGMVMMYFFGSTRGSADKTEAIMSMGRTNQYAQGVKDGTADRVDLEAK